MAIHGKQLKDASIDLTKLEGISAPTSGQLLLAAAGGAAQALTLDGDLSQSTSGSTLTLVVKDEVLEVANFAAAAVVDSADEISVSTADDTSLPTTAAVKSYVDSAVSTSSGNQSLSFAGDSGSDALALSTDTFTIAGGSNLTTAVTNNRVEIALDPNISLTSATLSGALSVGGDAVITGNLTVNGTTTTVNSTTVTVDDKNLELGSVASPSDTTADGGGITLKGATDKTFNWVDATDAWTSSEHMDLASSKSYHIAGDELLVGTGVKKVDSAALQTTSYLQLDTNNKLAVDTAALFSNAVTTIDGNGINNIYDQLYLDLNELAGAPVDVAADSIAFIDNSASNATRKETIADFVDAIAGTGLTSSAGQINLGYVKQSGACLDQTAGSNSTIGTLQTGYVSTSVSLSINGIEYPVGSSTAGYWHIDANDKVQWNSGADFLVDSNDTYILSYFKSA